ncbi:MAG: hypothetical protein M5U28_03705 [Sandaracinaceae bacterium]|nr:hypothetical protein [Sandaracinaceae bacterium]
MAETRALPPSLRELAERVRADAALPRHAAAVDPRPPRAGQRSQAPAGRRLAALARSSAPSARRVIDLGAGHGHLTRRAGGGAGSARGRGGAAPARGGHRARSPARSR